MYSSLTPTSRDLDEYLAAIRRYSMEGEDPIYRLIDIYLEGNTQISFVKDSPFHRPYGSPTDSLGRNLSLSRDFPGPAQLSQAIIAFLGLVSIAQYISQTGCSIHKSSVLALPQVYFTHPLHSHGSANRIESGIWGRFCGGFREPKPGKSSGRSYPGEEHCFERYGEGGS